jgi:hypothetical protein
MGLSDFFGDISTKFKDVSRQVGNSINKAYNSVEQKIENIIGTAHKDAGNVLYGVKDSADKIVSQIADVDKLIVNKTGDVFIKGEDSIASIGKAFSWPLVIGAGIFGLVLLKK